MPTIAKPFDAQAFLIVVFRSAHTRPPSLSCRWMASSMRWRNLSPIFISSEANQHRTPLACRSACRRRASASSLLEYEMNNEWYRMGALPHFDIGGEIDRTPQAIFFMKRAKCERGVRCGETPVN